MQIVIAVGMWIFQVGVVVWIALPLLGVWPDRLATRLCGMLFGSMFPANTLSALLGVP